MKISKEKQEVAVEWCKKNGLIFIKWHKSDFEYFDGTNNRRKLYVNAAKELGKL